MKSSKEYCRCGHHVGWHATGDGHCGRIGEVELIRQLGSIADDSAAIHDSMVGRDSGISTLAGRCCDAARSIIASLAKPSAEPAAPIAPAAVVDAQVKHMVDRFLGWKLPENFNPDGGISFKKLVNANTRHQYRNEPTGTNLLDAVQAEEMVRYIIEGCAVASAGQNNTKRIEDLRAVHQNTVRYWEYECAKRDAENDRLKAYLNTPETDDFFKGIEAEAAHQRYRWPAENDAGKTPADWFWLVGYLAGKCLSSHIVGDTEKALHHTISTAAALANWHRAIKGVGDMRPGIDTPVESRKEGEAKNG